MSVSIGMTFFNVDVVNCQHNYVQYIWYVFFRLLVAGIFLVSDPWCLNIALYIIYRGIHPVGMLISIFALLILKILNSILKNSIYKFFIPFFVPILLEQCPVAIRTFVFKVIISNLSFFMYLNYLVNIIVLKNDFTKI